MSLLTTNIRLIDRQSAHRTLLEVYAGPDGRRIRFFADPVEAYSQVWSDAGWREVHHLLIERSSPFPPEEAITHLFKATEDILGWKEQGST